MTVEQAQPAGAPMRSRTGRGRRGLFLVCLVCLWPLGAGAQPVVGDTPTAARAADGSYISWREHIIDEPATAGFGLSWTETVLGRYSVPQNAEPVDLDGDGDL